MIECMERRQALQEPARFQLVDVVMIGSNAFRKGQSRIISGRHHALHMQY